MRLLTHNLLVCNVTSCLGKNVPLQLHPAEVTEDTQPFNAGLTQKMIAKLEWSHFAHTAAALGYALPENQEDWTEEAHADLLQLIHRLLFNVHVQSGHLLCPECGRQYPIDRGIPNMVLQEE